MILMMVAKSYKKESKFSGPQHLEIRKSKRQPGHKAKESSQVIAMKVASHTWNGPQMARHNSMRRTAPFSILSASFTQLGSQAPNRP